MIDSKKDPDDLLLHEDHGEIQEETDAYILYEDTFIRRKNFFL